MQTQAKQGWLVTRMPCLRDIKAGMTRRERAPGAPWAATLPALLGVLLLVLLGSGLVLATAYDPRDAYGSLQRVAREMRGGWIMLGYHATGASLAFMALYLHLFRALLTRAYRAPGEWAWLLWVTLLAVLLLAGWLGFVLHGGAGGSWSLSHAVSAAMLLPGFPGAVAMWFLGGAGLARLLVFHGVLALCAVALIWLARMAARQARPAPQGRALAFWPVYAAQYFAALAMLALVFALLLGFAPHWGQGGQNAIPAAPMVVPAVISHPWYLTPIAGLAGLFPGAAGHIWGVIAAAAVLYALPWLDRSRGAPPGRLYRALTWLLGLDVLALGLAVSCPAGALLAGPLAIWFFFHFLVLTPLVTMLEAA
ncbi:cytochrome b N-terminal domain-containing protein [Acidocella sp.]|uniref:cytochrome b N-terminal domain-containing protein n=1 Tax=Acidocella sp. TaxID=50710 RepID=UPI003CFF8950